MSLVSRGIQFGIWWASNPTRVLSTVGLFWLNTLKGPLGDWSREMTWGITKGAGKAALSGLSFTARTTWSKLLVPVGIWARPAVVHVGSRIAVGATIVAPPLAVGAGVLATAAVISGVIVAGQQQVGLVGPDAPIMAGDPRWFEGLEMNPFMFSMGTVV